MSIDNAVLSFAGFVVLAELGTRPLRQRYWLLLTAFAGLNMLQAGFTGFCPAAIIFKAFGLKGLRIQVGCSQAPAVGRERRAEIIPSRPSPQPSPPGRGLRPQPLRRRSLSHGRGTG